MRQLLLAGALAALAPLATAAEPALELFPVEENILKKTNAERERAGLRPLAVSAELMQSARDHAKWMCKTGQFRHSEDRVAENIAMGQSSSSEAIQSWMNSPGHRKNMLNPVYQRIGVAAYQMGPGEKIYWIQQLLP